MTRLLPKHRGARVCLFATAVLVCVVPWGLAWLRMDNGIERWVASDAAAAHYAAFEEDFGGEDFLILAYAGGPLFDEEALDLQLVVLAAVEAIPEVTSVQSLPSLFRDHFGAESGEELAAEIESSPFYDGAIVSRDRAMAGMMIGSQTAFSSAGRRDYVAAVRLAAQPLRDAGWRTFVVGPGAVNATLDATSEAESRRLLPVAMAASSVLLLVLLRSVKKVAAVAAVSALSLVLTLGLMGWLGLTMNMVTVALPPVLWVLSTAYTVHLLRYYDRAKAETSGLDVARESALRWAMRPSLLAALTTALGFLALMTAGMTPVRELGLAAALGVPVAFLVTFGVTPLLFPCLPKTTNGPGVSPGYGPGALRNRAGFILLVAVLLAAGSAVLATRVQIESNPLTFLSPESPLVQDSNAVADNFTGLYTLETVLQLPGSWLDPAVWPVLEEQADALSANEGVARVLSPLDYLKKLNQWSDGGAGDAYRFPETGEAAAALIAEAPEASLAPLHALVSPDGTRVRLSSLIREMDGQQLLDIVEASEGALARARDVTGYQTGVVLRLVRAQFALIETQLESLALAIAVIFGVLAVGLRSRKLLLLSIAPNLAPILALFGIMGLVGIPLDPATVMVAAMALGIAVDDTMHLLVTWRERTGDGRTPEAALREALRVNGPAMIATTLTACTGFLALALSDFAPIRYFGLLSASAMAVALAADLWLLPALIQFTTSGYSNSQ